MIKNVYSSTCEVPVSLVIFQLIVAFHSFVNTPSIVAGCVLF